MEQRIAYEGTDREGEPLRVLETDTGWRVERKDGEWILVSNVPFSGERPSGMVLSRDSAEKLFLDLSPKDSLDVSVDAVTSLLKKRYGLTLDDVGGRDRIESMVGPGSSMTPQEVGSYFEEKYDLTPLEESSFTPWKHARHNFQVEQDGEEENGISPG